MTHSDHVPRLRGTTAADEDVLHDLETITLCTPDAYGRLIGKKISVDDYRIAMRDGIAMSNFHLATNPANTVIGGLSVTGAHTGFPNGTLAPDTTTLRRLPWDTSTALVLCDVNDHEGTAVDEAPRAILRSQVARLADRGLTAQVATELEFYVFRNTYTDAWNRNFSDLTPLFHRHGDHDVLVTEVLDDFLGAVRRSMSSMGVTALATLGEGGIGQAEINYPHGEPVKTADNHVLFKHCVRSTAQRHGLAATFMAKYDEAEPGSSCHLHVSLWGLDAAPTHADAKGKLSDVARLFLSGLLGYVSDFQLLHTPFSNSFSRIQPGSWAPATRTWGYDNRTTLVRVVGSGPSLRFEFRLPGADANPYLSIAALLAAGIAGIDHAPQLPPPWEGNAYDASVEHNLLGSLVEAIGAFDTSPTALKAFGPDVHRHLVSRARNEARDHARAVTDWDRRRGFETA